MEAFDTNKYYLGTLCKREHDYNNTGKSLRYKKGRNCYCCLQEYYQSNKDTMYSNYKKWKSNNKERYEYLKHKHRLEYKEIALEKNKQWYQNNKDKHNESYRNYINNRLKTDSKFRLKHNISKSISKSIKRNKNGNHWEDLVGYTLKDLKKHLEKQFIDGMTWDNYGNWHIDHIIPVSLWEFETSEDNEFKQCWSLANLQPLWAKENISKGNRI